MLLGVKHCLMQGVKINTCDSADTKTILLSLISVELLMPDRCYWCLQHLWRNICFHLGAVGNMQCSCCVLWRRGNTCRGKGRFREGADSGLICQAQLWLVDPLQCSLGRIILHVDTQFWVFGGKRLLLGCGLCIHLALFCRAKQGSFSRHVLSDAVVGGSHFVNRSEQRYFHNTCLCYQWLYNVLRRTAACTVTKLSDWACYLNMHRGVDFLKTAFLFAVVH